MEILLLFILNIFTGALIYLLLSLKIERNSSTFQEQKLRKEMGEIITEFNSTAERNITLLEARISVLKRLMGENGSLKSMDITMDHKPEIEKVIHDLVPQAGRMQKPASENGGSTGDRIITKNAADIAEISFNGASADNRSAEKQSVLPSADKKNSKNSYVHSGVFRDDPGSGANSPASRGRQVDFISNEDFAVIPDEPGPEEVENPADLFLTAENKYALIAELHGRGYSVEDLAVYSGLPAGEVRLVISLNKSPEL